MSAASAVLDALSTDPVTTDELYDRIGYLTLTRLGLVPYPAFRAALTKLSGDGLIEAATAPDGATTWRLPDPA